MTQEQYKKVCDQMVLPENGLSFVIGPTPGKWVSSIALMEWMVSKKLVPKKRDAVALGNLLLEKGHLTPAKPVVKAFDEFNDYLLKAVIIEKAPATPLSSSPGEKGPLASAASVQRKPSYRRSITIGDDPNTPPPKAPSPAPSAPFVVTPSPSSAPSNAAPSAAPLPNVEPKVEAKVEPPVVTVTPLAAKPLVGPFVQNRVRVASEPESSLGRTTSASAASPGRLPGALPRTESPRPLPGPSNVTASNVSATSSPRPLPAVANAVSPRPLPGSPRVSVGATASPRALPVINGPPASSPRVSTSAGSPNSHPQVVATANPTVSPPVAAPTNLASPKPSPQTVVPVQLPVAAPSIMPSLATSAPPPQPDPVLAPVSVDPVAPPPLRTSSAASSPPPLPSNGSPRVASAPQPIPNSSPQLSAAGAQSGTGQSPRGGTPPSSGWASATSPRPSSSPRSSPATVTSPRSPITLTRSNDAIKPRLSSNSEPNLPSAPPIQSLPASEPIKTPHSAPVIPPSIHTTSSSPPPASSPLSVPPSQFLSSSPTPSPIPTPSSTPPQSSGFVPVRSHAPRESRVMMGNRRPGGPASDAATTQAPATATATMVSTIPPSGELKAPAQTPSRPSHELKFEPAVFSLKHPDFHVDHSYVNVHTRSYFRDLVEAFCDASRMSRDDLAFSESPGGPEISLDTQLAKLKSREVYVKFLGPRTKRPSRILAAPAVSDLRGQKRLEAIRPNKKVARSPDDPDDEPIPPNQVSHHPIVPPISFPQELLDEIVTEITFNTEGSLLEQPPKSLSPLLDLFKPKKAAPHFDDKKRKALLQKMEKEIEKEKEQREREAEKEREAEANRERKEKKKADKDVLLADSLAKLAQVHQQIAQMLVKPDLVLCEQLALLCEHASVDSQVKIFRKLLHAAGGDLMSRFLEKAIRNEVALTSMQTTLFRSNNFTVVMIAAHSRVVGLGYLKALLTPLLEWVLETGEDYELNPVKVVLPPPTEGQPEQDPTPIVETNKARLKEALDKFFTAIISSLDQMPMGMKQVCILLKKEVEAKFPTAIAFTMGGYYFLRLVCPSIVSPEGFGILEREIDQSARRPLVLISKILQNLANETAFKEEYMQVMNEWMTEATPKMNDFLLKLAQGVFKHVPLNYSGLDINPEEYRSLAGFVARTYPKIQKKFQENPSMVSNVGYPLQTLIEGFLAQMSALEAGSAALEAEISDKSKKKKDKESEKDRDKDKDKEKEKEKDEQAGSDGHASSGSRDSRRSRRLTDPAIESAITKK